MPFDKEVTCCICEKFFEGEYKAEVQGWGVAACPDCRKACEMGRKVLVTLEELGSGLPHGSEVDRLTAIISDLDTRIRVALIERNENAKLAEMGRRAMAEEIIEGDFTIARNELLRKIKGE